MRATLTRDAFDDPDWLFETKWDGFRVEAVVSDGTVELWTRGHQDASRYFGRFLEPPTWIDADSAVVDGEVVAFDAQGEPDFGLLQQQIGRSGRGAVAASSSTRRSTCSSSMAPRCWTGRSTSARRC